MTTTITATFNAHNMARRMQRLAKQLPEATDRGMRNMAQDIKAEFDITTFTWDKRPEFKIEGNGQPGQYKVGTDNVIYAYVDRGTRPHVIRARRAPFLVFALGSSPKTQPGSLGSYGGLPGNQWRKAKSVNHPGIRARNFRDTIYQRFRGRGVEYVIRAIEAEVYGGGMYS